MEQSQLDLRKHYQFMSLIKAILIYLWNLESNKEMKMVKRENKNFLR